MVSDQLFLLIIAGGSGTRFWPKSTSVRPKQLLAFGEQGTLLEQTLRRFDAVVPEKPAHRIIITTRKLEAAVAEELKGVKILAEPQGRNTAPCVYWGAREVAAKNPDAILLVMPADHYIPRHDDFLRTLREAAEWAATHDDLVTLGVRPTRPETGYGYLKVGKPAKTGSSCVSVEAFVEKPNEEKAREFVESGNYLWNGGMFLWKAKTILDAFDQFMPEMKKAWDASGGDVEKAYPLLSATSIDYGVMEKARNVVSFPLDCGWDDLGSWTSLENIADALGARRGDNVATGGELLAVESSGNIVDAPNRLIALLGVDDLIVVESGQSILVAKKSRAQDIRLIVDALKKQRPELV
ncbi:MAG: hypothetical protein A2X94_03085 [Bdellovibrionales bacterium GWB1_55_8]|nr:MAG: hypothetical protein A2X94_03085 [Bdellovibrionales bacterium GWB1_55_8]